MPLERSDWSFLKGLPRVWGCYRLPFWNGGFTFCNKHEHGKIGREREYMCACMCKEKLLHVFVCVCLSGSPCPYSPPSLSHFPNLWLLLLTLKLLQLHLLSFAHNALTHSRTGGLWDNCSWKHSKFNMVIMHTCVIHHCIIRCSIYNYTNHGLLGEGLRVGGREKK